MWNSHYLNLRQLKHQSNYSRGLPSSELDTLWLYRCESVTEYIWIASKRTRWLVSKSISLNIFIILKGTFSQPGILYFSQKWLKLKFINGGGRRNLKCASPVTLLTNTTPDKHNPCQRHAALIVREHHTCPNQRTFCKVPGLGSSKRSRTDLSGHFRLKEARDTEWLSTWSVGTEWTLSLQRTWQATGQT